MTWTDELTDVDYLKSIYVALHRMEAALAVLPELARQPAPIVHVSPPDLTEVVEAVVGLKGGPAGPSAGDIAAAIAEVLAPGRPDTSSEALRQVTEGLERLETVLRSTGRTNFGGAIPKNISATLSPAMETGLAKDATLLRRYGDHVTKADVVSTTGDNTLHTPASSKKIRLYWIGLSASQDNTAENLIQVKLTDADGTVKYRWRMGNPGAFVGGRTIEGNVNEPLILNLANAQPIDWNVDLEEVT